MFCFEITVNRNSNPNWVESDISIQGWVKQDTTFCENWEWILFPCCIWLRALFKYESYLRLMLRRLSMSHTRIMTTSQRYCVLPYVLQNEWSRQLSLEWRHSMKQWRRVPMEWRHEVAASHTSHATTYFEWQVQWLYYFKLWKVKWLPRSCESTPSNCLWTLVSKESCIWQQIYNVGSCRILTVVKL